MGRVAMLGLLFIGCTMHVQYTEYSVGEAIHVRRHLMDCLQGVAAVSMQWGAWGGTGMAVVHNLLPRIIKSGLGVLQPTSGLEALHRVLAVAAPAPQLVVSPFEWPKLMQGAEHVFPVFSEFAEHWKPKQAQQGQHHAAVTTASKATSVSLPQRVAQQPRELHAAGSRIPTAVTVPRFIPGRGDDATSQQAVMHEVQSLVEHILGSAAAAQQLLMGLSLDPQQAQQALQHAAVARPSKATPVSLPQQLSRQPRAMHAAGSRIPTTAAPRLTPARADDAARQQAVMHEVQSLVERILGSAASPDQPLMEAELDSMGSVELRTSLSARFGIELPATVTFDYPTPAALAKYMASVTASNATMPDQVRHALLYWESTSTFKPGSKLSDPLSSCPKQTCRGLPSKHTSVHGQPHALSTFRLQSSPHPAQAMHGGNVAAQKLMSTIAICRF